MLLDPPLLIVEIIKNKSYFYLLVALPLYCLWVRNVRTFDVATPDKEEPVGKCGILVQNEISTAMLSMAIASLPRRT